MRLSDRGAKCAALMEIANENVSQIDCSGRLVRVGSRFPIRREQRDFRHRFAAVAKRNRMLLVQLRRLLGLQAVLSGRSCC